MQTATPIAVLNITGDIAVHPVLSKVPSPAHLYLIMGPTGAGKSSVSGGSIQVHVYDPSLIEMAIESSFFPFQFIESFTPESQHLSISSNRLDPFTQRVTAYRLVNVSRDNNPVYLIDTPGFSDRQISELEIMDMVREWLEYNNLQYFQNIIYMIPTNETRLPGSKRRTIDMLQAFLKPSGDLGSVVFTTSMWDQCFNPRTTERAEANFAQLQDILKDLVDRKSTITRFENTPSSALGILSSQFRVNYAFGNAGSYAMPQLYHNLHNHIANALEEIKMLQDELSQANHSQSNTEPENAIKLMYENRLKNVNRLAIKLVEQWLTFGDPPRDAEQEAKHLHHNIVAANLRLQPEHLQQLRDWEIRAVTTFPIARAPPAEHKVLKRVPLGLIPGRAVPTVSPARRKHYRVKMTRGGG